MSAATTGLGASGHEEAVSRRYSEAARARQEALCCPMTAYDPALLQDLPAEIVERDYGCGDPTKWVTPGEHVIDLGSGSGKVCYMLSRKVGPAGSVVGVDCNDSMLALARRHHAEMVRRFGYDNVRFVKAKIQDMALDLEAVSERLERHPVGTVDDWAELDRYCEELRAASPAVPDDSTDAVVSNCVLNLVKPADKERLFREIHRVLRRGGRAVISDIVCDEDPTPQIVSDPRLWSGCIAGAFREDRLLTAFEAAGFYGVEILSRAAEPWRVIDGIEFRSVTVRAFKGKEGACLERNQAVIYKGPWKSVQDDDGHTLLRGKRMAVCDKTFRIMTDPNGPYTAHVSPVPSRVEVAPEAVIPFNCHGTSLRDPRQTKGMDYRETIDDGTDAGACCGPEGCC